MINNNIIKALNLTKEQTEIYIDLSRKESVLRKAVIRCGVHRACIDKIINKCDVSKFDPDNVDSLDEAIKQDWGEFIIKNENN